MNLLLKSILSLVSCRYYILNPNIAKGFTESREVTANILKAIELPEDNYRIGLTKACPAIGLIY